MKIESPPGASLDALTSLRFFAAIAVVFFHVPFVLTKSVGKEQLLGDGALGVSFFFILSGFILKHAYSYSELNFLQFYRKRIFRVLPLHYLTLAIWVLIFFNGWGNSLQDKLNSGVANILVIHSFFNGQLFNLGFNAVSWSISVELFFYAIFPVIRKNQRCLYVFIVYGIVFAVLPKSISDNINTAWPSFFYFNPVSRLFEFSGGVALYTIYKNITPAKTVASILQAISVALLIFSVLATAGFDTHHRNLILFFPFSLVILSFAWDGVLKNVLSIRPLVLLGEASFSLYMIHHMLFRGLDNYLHMFFSPLQSLFLAIGVAIVLSVLIFYYFERPVRMYMSTGQA